MSNGNCSFCGKRHDQVFRLIASDGAKICNECIGRCADMIAQEYTQISRELQFASPSKKGGEGSAS